MTDDRNLGKTTFSFVSGEFELPRYYCISQNLEEEARKSQLKGNR